MDFLSLDKWNAVGFSDKSVSGYSQPLLLICKKAFTPNEDEVPDNALDENLEQDKFVIKTLGGRDVDEDGLFSELFVSLLARKFGILTTPPALIHISDDFVKNLSTERKDVVSGYAVGFKYVGNLEKIDSSFVLPERLKPAAALLYAFDLLTQNGDRTFWKGGPEKDPNCAILDGDIVAYDFIECFGLSCTGEKAQILNFSNLGWRNSHVFYRFLHGSEVDWTPFIEGLSDLNRQDLNDMVEVFPEAWLVNKEARFDYLLVAKERCEELRAQLDATISE